MIDDAPVDLSDLIVGISVLGKELGYQRSDALRIYADNWLLMWQLDEVGLLLLEERLTIQWAEQPGNEQAASRLHFDFEPLEPEDGAMKSDDLEKRVQRLENQVAALRQANLILLATLGKLLTGQKLSPDQIEILRGQYRAIESLTLPKVG
ncbi:MAG TPA: hypothetical protein V6D07_09725 [Trichocoleus sp.]